MPVNDHWIYQGRQSHGWFGTGTAPKDDATDADGSAAANDLFRPANADQRVDYAAHSIILDVPRSERGRWTHAASDAVRDSLKTAVAAWYGASGLSRDAFRTRFLNPYTSDATVDRLRGAARGMVEGRSYDDLAVAGEDLAAAAQRIGADRWPRFVGDAARQAQEAVSRGDVPGVVKAGLVEVLKPGVTLLLGGLSVWLWGQTDGRQQSGRQAPVPQPAPPTVMEAVPVPPVKEGETPAEVLKPDGQYVGEPGNSSKVRILPGGEDEARELFERLTKGKGGTDITPAGHVGQVIMLPDGSVIGFRPVSGSGPPTVDVNVSGVRPREIKFLRKDMP